MLVYLCWLLLMCSLYNFTNGSTAFKITKIECFPNPTFIRNATCNIKAVDRYRSYANMKCEIVDQIRNASLHLEVFMKNTANQYKPFLVNITRNLCDILDKKSFPAYATIMMNILKQVSNVNHSCPFKGSLIVKNLYVDEKYLPVAPLGFYKISFQFLEGFPYKDLGTVILYFEVSEIRKARPRPQPKHLLGARTLLHN